jgi:hypothetical protein
MVAGSGILDAGYWMLDTEFRILAIFTGIQHLKSSI